MKKIVLHFLLAIGFAFIPYLVVELYVKLVEDAGSEFLSILYILILFVQILYYFLTTNFGILLSSISFVINFIFWTAEQVNLESAFEDSWLYQKENFNGLIILGGILWAVNKLIIDWIYLNRNIKPRKSIVDKLINFNIASTQNS